MIWRQRDEMTSDSAVIWGIKVKVMIERSVLLKKVSYEVI